MDLHTKEFQKGDFYTDSHLLFHTDLTITYDGGGGVDLICVERLKQSLQKS